VQHERPATFVVRIRIVNKALEITLQNLRTRQILTFSSWELLFQELQRSSGEVTP
jgi:hypothetical protein